MGAQIGGAAYAPLLGALAALARAPAIRLLRARARARARARIRARAVAVLRRVVLVLLVLLVLVLVVRKLALLLLLVGHCPAFAAAGDGYVVSTWAKPKIGSSASSQRAARRAVHRRHKAGVSDWRRSAQQFACGFTPPRVRAARGGRRHAPLAPAALRRRGAAAGRRPRRLPLRRSARELLCGCRGDGLPHRHVLCGWRRGQRALPRGRLQPRGRHLLHVHRVNVPRRHVRQRACVLCRVLPRNRLHRGWAVRAAALLLEREHAGGQRGGCICQWRRRGGCIQQPQWRGCGRGQRCDCWGLQHQPHPHSVAIRRGGHACRKRGRRVRRRHWRGRLLFWPRRRGR